MTAEQLIESLRRAKVEEDWDIPEETLARLAATAPALPTGREEYLSFRIRFGTGSTGVALTFEAHVRRVLRVCASAKPDPRGRRPRADALRSGPESLRLLVGDNRHRPAVEWVTIRLDSYRYRDSVHGIRDWNLLADEGLVLAWLYPELVRAIDWQKRPSWLLAGYEVNVTGGVSQPWSQVPGIDCDLDTSAATLDVYPSNHNQPDFSVPQVLGTGSP